MNVTKVESVIPFTAVTPSLPLSGDAEGRRGGVTNTSREREVKEAIQKANEAPETLEGV